jgi:hypothetical protein
LGFIISRDAINKGSRITSAIRDFQHPNDPNSIYLEKSLLRIRSFLCLCNFYRRFIRDYAKVERLLCDLTRKDLVMWSWEQKHEDSFLTLKDRLCSDQVLAFPAPVTEVITM